MDDIEDHEDDGRDKSHEDAHDAHVGPKDVDQAQDALVDELEARHVPLSDLQFLVLDIE